MRALHQLAVTQVAITFGLAFTVLHRAFLVLRRPTPSHYIQVLDLFFLPSVSETADGGITQLIERNFGEESSQVLLWPGRHHNNSQGRDQVSKVAKPHFTIIVCFGVPLLRASLS